MKNTRRSGDPNCARDRPQADTPQDIALAFQNYLAFLLGQNRVWEDSYYVGTFGEYDMGAVRR